MDHSPKSLGGGSDSHAANGKNTVPSRHFLYPNLSLAIEGAQLCALNEARWCVNFTGTLCRDSFTADGIQFISCVPSFTR